MKKIIALVLSLVMALSLCTVAFAADGVVDHIYKKGADGQPDKTVDYVNDLKYVKATTDKATGGGTVAYYTNGYEGEILLPCEKDDDVAVQYAIYKNGSFVTWVNTATVADAEYEFVVKAQKATTALPNCTTSQFFEDGYVDADGCCFYVDGDDTAVNYDGKIIYVDDVTDNADYVVWASHIFAKGVANDKTGYDVATCLICKGEFACTNDVAVATKNGYKISTGFSYDSAAAELVYEENYYDNGYDFKWGQAYAGNYEYCWQLKAGTTEEIGTAATETTTGVESAKTFDAGIAMYVGMSLMSVAGTAVVIGKKKEF